MSKTTKKVRLPISVTIKEGREKKTVPPGTEITLPAEEAAEYLDRYGPYKGQVHAPPAEPQKPAKPSGQALTAEIVEAIASLDVKDNELFTADGKPSVSALEKILGYDISAQERDQALAAAKAA